ncbi:MAG: macro domain-containing protein [Ruminococcaceae bacterium]|jgi:O-acetyl-ADP-ribose deacetylase (regulator of RNase III)|nr:macro domain-containing protein [Oscillospiraceae bacterium]
MPFYLIHGDITKIRADAIVNAANPSLLGGGGVDGAIHRAAGPGLRKECETLGGCAPGEAKRTAAYGLPARFVIHTVGPVWEGGGRGEEEILASCYRRSLHLAAESGCASVAFPLVSAGAYGMPRPIALRVAGEEIGAFLADGHDEMTVLLVLFDPPASMRGTYGELNRTLEGLTGFPREANPCSAAAPEKKKGLFRRVGFLAERAPRADACKRQEESAPPTLSSAGGFFPDTAADSVSLEEALSMIDESFSEMLLRKIDERGMKDAECYRRANVDRKLFSKIRSDPQYRPSKTTALAFAIALELSLAETEELLLKAGYALSPSAPFDVIVKYFIERGNYNVFEINEALYAFDQKQIGA